MPYYNVVGESYICIECGKKSNALLENPVMVKVCNVGPDGLEEIQDELMQKTGVCQHCYSEKYNDPQGELEPLRLIKEERVCLQNVHNIQSETFEQVDAKKKYYRYKRMAMRLAEQLARRVAFEEANVNGERFYTFR